MHLELCERLGIIVCGMFIKPFIHAIMKMGEASITPYSIFRHLQRIGRQDLARVWGGFTLVLVL